MLSPKPKLIFLNYQKKGQKYIVLEIKFMSSNLIFLISVPIRDVSAVSEGRAELPCDIDPPDPSDRVYLVLWYRELAGKPLYSFDLRYFRCALFLYQKISFIGEDPPIQPSIGQPIQPSGSGPEQTSGWVVDQTAPPPW